MPPRKRSLFFRHDYTSFLEGLFEGETDGSSRSDRDREGLRLRLPVQRPRVGSSSRREGGAETAARERADRPDSPERVAAAPAVGDAGSRGGRGGDGRREGGGEGSRRGGLAPGTDLPFAETEAELDLATGSESESSPERLQEPEPDRTVEPVYQQPDRPRYPHPDRGWFYDQTPNRPKTTKAILDANIEGLRILKRLSDERRSASKEEQAILANYQGWGPVKEALNDSMAGLREYPWYREHNEDLRSWEKEYGPAYDSITALTTGEEKEALRESSTTAHYTPDDLCRTLWEIAQRLGFRGGAVLEPGCGTGRILSHMPADLRDSCKVIGVERDPITARIAQQLHPDYEIRNEPFEESRIPDHSVDLVIGNVPFSENGPINQEGNRQDRFNLHNFFIHRSLRKLKPGGIAVVLTSNATLDNQARQRARLAAEGELLAAFRLPNSGLASAQTEVVADILILRKPNGGASIGESWTATVPVAIQDESGSEQAVSNEPEPDAVSAGEAKKPKIQPINEVLLRHPDWVLGRHSMSGKMYRIGTYTVLSDDSREVMINKLRGLISGLPTDVLATEPAAITDAQEEEAGAERMLELIGTPDGEFVEVDGQALVWDASAGRAVPPPWRRTAADDPFLGPLQVNHPETLRLARELDEHSNEVALRRQALNAGFSGDQEDREAQAIYLAAVRLRAEAQQETQLPAGLSADAADVIALGYARLLATLNRQIAVDLAPVTTERESEDSRAELRARYESLTKLLGGPINTSRIAVSLFAGLQSWPSVSSLERTETKDRRVTVLGPAAIQTQRTLFPVAHPTKADSLADAVSISLDRVGRIDERLVGQLIGRDDPEGIATLLQEEGVAFRDPESGMLIDRTTYLSGNVRRKLEIARAAVRDTPECQRNVDALEAVQPADIPYSAIKLSLGSSWIPANVIRQFVIDEMGQDSSFDLAYSERAGLWMIGDFYEGAQARVYATDRVKAKEVLDAALSGREIRVTERAGPDGPTIYNATASAAANGRKNALMAAFVQWCDRNEQAKERLAQEFNQRFNAWVEPQYTGEGMLFPGLARGPGIPVPYPHQRAAVQRMLRDGCGCIIHDVGYGKTLTMILTIMESRRLGIVAKPMLVCDNPSYAQVLQSFRQLYPQAKILAGPISGGGARAWRRWLNSAAMGDWDAVVIPKSQFTKIGVSPERQAQYMQEQLADLEESHKIAAEAGMRKFVRQMEKAKEKLEARIALKLQEIRSHAYDDITFERLGVDLLVLDEAHTHKKMGLSTRFQTIKGLDVSTSQRAIDVMMKARFIQEKRGGKGMIAATATPVTNTMAESWNLIRLARPQSLRDFGVESFDTFFSSFCETITGPELSEATRRWKVVSRVAKFVNGEALIRFIRSAWDIQMDRSKLKLKVPEIEGGKPTLVVTPQTKASRAIGRRLCDLYEIYERSTAKRELSWVPITLMQYSMAASIDPRLFDPTSPDEPGSPLNAMIANIQKTYEETKEKKALQLVFCDRLRSMDTTILNMISESEGPMIELEPDKVTVTGAGGDEEGDEAEDKDETQSAKSSGATEFNLYDEIRRKLIAAGIPKESIGVCDGTKAAREALFAAANDGRLRVLIGSSQRLGTGVNVQRYAIAAHHLDPPRSLTPTDLTQRNGRIVRQGNQNETVRIYYYGQQDSATAGIYDRLRRKAEFASQVLAGRGTGVEFEDPAGAVDLAEMRGALVSDKRVLRLAELKNSVAHEKLMLQAQRDAVISHKQQVSGLERTCRRLADEEVPLAQKRKEHFREHVLPETDAWRVVIDGRTVVGDRKTVAEAIDAQIEKWNAFRLDVAMRRSGTIVCNGLAIEVQQQLAGVHDNSTVLVARVPDPVRPSSELAHATMSTSTAVFRLHAAAIQYAQTCESRLTEQIKETQAALEAVKQRAPSLGDPARLDELEKELQALEVDLVQNPFRYPDEEEEKENQEEAVSNGSQ